MYETNKFVMQPTIHAPTQLSNVLTMFYKIKIYFSNPHNRCKCNVGCITNFVTRESPCILLAIESATPRRSKNFLMQLDTRECNFRCNLTHLLIFYLNYLHNLYCRILTAVVKYYNAKEMYTPQTVLVIPCLL
jgi:hypothetical protein